ncbi:MAG TPA: amidohydrolase family protein [Candidatus Saccharimonadales bacterium]|nr:amidohydrolase family protein [Candidatus Saccharimonadales bacterium]
MGFTSALVVPEEGIFRGTSVLVTTGDGAAPGLIVRSDVAQGIAFERGGFGEGYPTSLMGAIAAVRQGLEDARRHQIWQARYDEDPSGLKRPDSVSAWAPLARVASGEMPVIFDMESPANVLRALAVGREYGLRAMVIGSGLEYEIAGDLARAGVPVILPLHYPDKPEMKDQGATLDVDTRDLQRYLGARTSAAALERAGVAFALGTCHMKKATEFTANLKEALDAGLEPEAALAALTTAPARMFGVDRSLGRLAPGMAADVVVRDKDPFAEGSKVEKVFVDGVEYPVEEKKPGDAKDKGWKGSRPEGGEGGAR